MSYDEHLISLAGGDGDSAARLAEIQKSNDMWMKSPHVNREDRNTAFLLAMVRERDVQIERAIEACDRIITNTDGHKPPGPPNPTREQDTAARIRVALTATEGTK